MSVNTQIEATSTITIQDTLNNLKKILGVWHFTANWMMRFTVIFGLATIISSVLVSVYTSTGIISPNAIKILACISTASLTLLTAFNIVNKGNNARQAWRILNAAIYKYETGMIGIKELIYAYEIGEKILGNVDFSFGAASKPEDSRDYRLPRPEDEKDNAPPNTNNVINDLPPNPEVKVDELPKPEDKKGDKNKRNEGEQSSDT